MKKIFMNPRKKHNTFDIFLDIFDKYPREYFVFAFFLFFFIAIIWRTFAYTVLDYDFYTKLAYRQQVGEIELPVTRGNLYSAASTTMQSGTVFSTSVDLNDLAIDPQIEGDKGKLSIFLTNIIYKEICYLKSQKDCYNDMLRFLKVLEIPNFDISEDVIKKSILGKIQQRLSKNKVHSVLLRKTLTADEETLILSWGVTGVYPSSAGLYINPEELLQRELFVTKYVSVFGGVEKNILHAIRQRDLRYIPIFQKVSLIGADEIQQYVSDERQALKQGIIEKQESIGGFIIMTPHAQRIYPERTTASQIIGFLDNQGQGHYGIEGYFNDILKGNPGEQLSKKDTQGRIIESISFGKDEGAALEGADIYTTIDRNVQHKVEEILEKGVKKFQANKGTVVVIEPKTGKILALANYPTFDPNNPGEVYELEKVNYGKYPTPETDLKGKTVFVEDVERGDSFYYDGHEIYLRIADREEYVDYGKTKYIYKNNFGAGVYQNDAISSLYEPGSIMKAITVAVGIDTGEIRAYDMYNDIGKVVISGFPISNVDKNCLGYHSFTHALSLSCNIGMIRIVQKIGKALLYKYLVDFGFDEKTGITLSGEISSKMDPYEKWPISKLLTSSYGLGITVTPLQMASAYSVLANGGIYMKPYILEKITFSDGKQLDYKPEPIRRVIKESTSKTVTNMLIKGVQTGAAKNGAVEGYNIAGKTGTSQIVYRGVYEKGVASTNGSFAGYAPAEDPRFVIVVKLERPRTSEYGGSTSAFIFSEIAEELLEYYSIPKKIIK